MEKSKQNGYHVFFSFPVYFLRTQFNNQFNNACAAYFKDNGKELIEILVSTFFVT